MSCTDANCGQAVTDMLQCNQVQKFLVENVTVDADTTLSQPYAYVGTLQPTDAPTVILFANRYPVGSGMQATFYFDYYSEGLVFFQTQPLIASSVAAANTSIYDSTLKLYNGTFQTLAKNCNSASCYVLLDPG